MQITGPRFEFESAKTHSTVSILPCLNDAAWSDIEEVGAEIQERILAEKSSAVIIDLTGLNYIGSSMVALIVRLWKAANSKKGQVVIVNQDPTVFEVLDIAGLTKVWTIVDSRESAAKYFGNQHFQGGGERLSYLLPILGVVATIGGLGGLIFMFNPTKDVTSEIALGMEAGFSSMALIVGVISAIRDRGAARIISILVVVCALAISIVGTLALFEVIPVAKGV